MKDMVSCSDGKNGVLKDLSTDQLGDALIRMRACADILEAIVSEAGVSRHVETQCYTLAASMRMFCKVADDSLNQVVDEMNRLESSRASSFPLDL